MANKQFRIDFHNALLECLGSELASQCHLYFQPPENFQMQYPAIVYSRNSIKNKSADDIVYSQGTEYQVTVIDKNPDSEIVDKISKFPTCRYSRHFNSANLNHDVFIIIYK